MNTNLKLNKHGEKLIKTQWVIKMFGVHIVHSIIFGYDSDYLKDMDYPTQIRIVASWVPYLTMRQLAKIYKLYVEGIRVFAAKEQKSDTLAMLNE